MGHNKWPNDQKMQIQMQLQHEKEVHDFIQIN
jgi:hypothetical protein